MNFPKEIARERNVFHRVAPEDLFNVNEYAEWLSALLYGQCYVAEYEGVLQVIEKKHLVDKDGRLKIEIYSDEHPPPHFHVKSADINASFSIEDCAIIDGKVTKGQHKTIILWHSKLKPKLIEIWNTTRPSGCTVGLYQGT